MYGIVARPTLSSADYSRKTRTVASRRLEKEWRPEDSETMVSKTDRGRKGLLLECRRAAEPLQENERGPGTERDTTGARQWRSDLEVLARGGGGGEARAGGRGLLVPGPLLGSDPTGVVRRAIATRAAARGSEAQRATEREVRAASACPSPAAHTQADWACAITPRPCSPVCSGIPASAAGRDARP
jgi:hypothetical protein